MNILFITACIFAFAMSQTCNSYTCGSLTAPACVAAPASGVVNVQACASGQYCAVLNPFGALVQTATNCETIPAPGPAPTNLPTGDTCTTNNQCQSSVCTKGACAPKAAMYATCALDDDCPVQGWCQKSNTTCMPTVAAGGACTPGQSITQTVPQCGYGAYCVNSKCVVPYSVANGDTGIPTTQGAAQWGATLCKSGAAAAGATNWFCVPAPKIQDAANLLTGYAAATTCTIVNTDAAGATTTTTTPAICGYNQNANYYCPWQAGDAPVATLLTSVNTVWAFVNSNCNPKSLGPTMCNAVASNSATSKLVPAVVQFSEIISGNALNIGALVANNAGCVKTTLTSMYWLT